MWKIKSSPAILVLLLIISPVVTAQESNSPFYLNGYISSMQSVMFERADDPWTNDNLVHNRINTKLFVGQSVTITTELRNRVFTGDMVRFNPDYAGYIGSDPGWADLSWNLIDNNSLLFNTTIDRFYIDISGKGYQLNIGRQRINWGQTLIWNPNDVFNAYSYFDFDYIERPGSDAIRFQLFPSYSSAIELAAKVNSRDKVTAAALFRFNRWGYDIQFTGGYVNGEDIVFGTGWSGAIGSTSFRGEISWFEPVGPLSDSSGTGLFTVGFDRSFSNNAMIQLQLMYCNDPLEFSDFGSFYTGSMSAKDLAISDFSLFTSLKYPVTPLVNLGASCIIYPDLKGFFAGPSADISLAGNIDFSLIWQYFKASAEGETLTMNLGFLRFKYSF